jgi:hypothetical protein
VPTAPFFVIGGPREVIKEFPPRHARLIGNDFLLLQFPRHPRRLGNQAADGVAIAAEGQILSRKDVLQMQSIDRYEGFVQYGPVYLEADEIVVGARSIPAAGHLQNIESEFRLDVCRRLVGIRHHLSILCPQFRILDRDRAIHRQFVAVDVGRIMGERAVGESEIL